MTSFGRKFLITILIFSCFFAASSLAQDSHHWNNQYGTKGSLLGGIVVGSPSDLSASFYNPGWVAYSDDPSFLMSTKAWELTNVEVTEGLGSGTEPTSSNLGTSPGFMAWRIKSFGSKDWKMVFSFLNRIRFNYNTSVTQASTNETSGSGTDQFYIGEAYRHANTDENWFGVTMARVLSDKISGGATLYGVYRSQRSRLEVSTSGMTLDGGYFDSRILDEFKFWNARVLAKIGFAYKGDPFSFGVTFTTPSLGVLGSGNVFQHTGFSRTDDVGGAPTETFLAADVQNDLKTQWKSSLSVAVGASWKMGNTRLHFSSEWFDAVTDQMIMEPSPYFSQSSGDQYYYESYYNYCSIINFGLGVEHDLEGIMALYGSFRSDYSLINDDITGNYLIADWDIWHISTGASFEIIGLDLTTGLQYSFGNGRTNRYINLGSGIESASASKFSSSDVDYRNLKLMVGFDFTFSTP